MRINSNGILVLFSFLFVLFLIPSAFASTLTAETITEEVDASITFTIEGASPDSLYSLEYNTTGGLVDIKSSFETDSSGDASFTADFDSSVALKGSNGYYHLHLRNEGTNNIEDSFWFQYGNFVRFFDDYKDASNFNTKEIPKSGCGGAILVDEINGYGRIETSGSTASCTILFNTTIKEGGEIIPTTVEFDFNSDSTGGFSAGQNAVYLRLTTSAFTGGSTLKTITDSPNPSLDGHMKIDFNYEDIDIYINGTLTDSVSYPADNELYLSFQSSGKFNSGHNADIQWDNVIFYGQNGSSNFVFNENTIPSSPFTTFNIPVYQSKGGTAQWTTEEVVDDGTGSPSYFVRVGNNINTTGSLSTFTNAEDSLFMKPVFQLSADSVTDTNLQYWKGNYELGGVSTGTDTIIGVQFEQTESVDFTQSEIISGGRVRVSSDPSAPRLISVNITEYDDNDDFVQSITTLTDTNPLFNNEVDLGDPVSAFYPLSTIANEDYRYEITAIMKDYSGTIIDTFTINSTRNIGTNSVRLHVPSGNFVSPTGEFTIIAGANVQPSLSGMNDFELRVFLDDVLVRVEDMSSGIFDPDFSRNFGIQAQASEGVHTITVQLVEDDAFDDDILDEDTLTFTLLKDDQIRLISPINGQVITNTNQVELKYDYKTFQTGTIVLSIQDGETDTINVAVENTNGERRLKTIISKPLDDDDYTWSATYQPNSGGTSFFTGTQDFTIQFEATSITAISPGSDILLQDDTPDFIIQVDANTPGELQVILDDAVFYSQSIGIKNNEFLTLSPGTSISENNHTWYARHISNTGTVTDSNSLSFQIVDPDTLGAFITLINPEENDIFEGNSVDFAFDVNSTNVTGTVRLVVDGNNKAQFTIPSIGDYNFNSTVDALTSGDHSWYVDYDMNTSQTLRSQSRQFTIENNITIDLIQPTDGAIIETAPVSFVGSLTTQGSGVIYLILDEAVVDSKQIDLKPFETLEEVRQTFTVSNLESGTHVWRIAFTEKGEGDAFDGATSETRTFKILTSTGIGGGTEGIDNIQDNGLIDRFIGGTASLLGLSETSAGFLIAVLLSLALAVGVSSIPSVKSAEHGAMVLIFVFIAGLVISSVALGLLSTSIIIVLVIIAGGLIFIASKRAGGG